MGEPVRIQAATPDRPPVKDRPDRLQVAEEAVEPRPPASRRPGGPLDTIRWGLGAAWTCRRLLIFILAANLFLAAAALFPMLGPVDSMLSHNPDAGRIGEDLDQAFWFDLTHTRALTLIRTVSLVGLASFVMVFAGAFFAGGLLEAMRHGRRQPISFEPMPDPGYGGAVPPWRAAAPGPATIQVFLKESARHFPRFLVLLLLSLPIYALVQILFNEYGSLVAGWLLDRIEDERLALLITFAKSALFVAAFHAATVIFEYARVHEVIRPGTSLVPLVALPFRLLVSRPLSFLGIEIIAVLLQAAALVAFIPVDRLLGRWPLVAVTAGFLGTQIFMFTRLLIRSGTQAAQLRLAEDFLQEG
jgi:hypothetical protein